MRELHIIALASHGEGISGGDRIFIELARNLQKKFKIIIHTWEEGVEMLNRQDLFENKNIKIISYKFPLLKFKGNFLFNYFLRIILGIYLGFVLKIKNSNKIFIYSASEFWMDTLCSLIIKNRYKKINWIATWFQTAPNPLKGFSEGKNRESRYRLKAFLYWFSQLPIKPLIKLKADFVLVNNESEKKVFRKLDKNKKLFVMIGAVPLRKIKLFISKNKTNKKIYDAVFQGRLHPQKGAVELIDIWKKVVNRKPKAKLAIIGDGSLMNDVKSKIKKLRLEKNIKLFGYMFDGEEKFKVFTQSKVVVHPAFFDSGGMASAEAMAFGLPVVGFDLLSYKSYYPKGMLKVEKGNLNKFANAILELLNNSKKRNMIGRETKSLIYKNYSWEKRSEQFYEFLIK